MLKRFVQDALDLPVEASELVVGPASERFEHLRLDPEQIGISFGHGPTPSGKSILC